MQMKRLKPDKPWLLAVASTSRKRRSLIFIVMLPYVGDMHGKDF
jgi:hypothetical protein